MAVVRLHGDAQAHHTAVRLPHISHDDVVLPTLDDRAHAGDEIRVARFDAEYLQDLALRLADLHVIVCPARLQDEVLKILDRKSTRLNSSHRCISYAVFCLKKKKKKIIKLVQHSDILI